MVIGFDILAF